MTTLTKAYIAGLKPKKNKFTAPDTGTDSVLGLRVVVYPSGSKSWAVFYDSGKHYASGKKKKHSEILGSIAELTREQARVKAIEIILQVKDNDTQAQQAKVKQRQKAKTEIDFVAGSVHDLFSVYLADRREQGKKTVDRIESYLMRRIPTNFRMLEARTVTADDVEDMLDATFDKDSSWNIALAFTKSAWALAHSRKKHRAIFGFVSEEGNNISRMKKRNVKVKRTYVPTLSELACLWVECENWMGRHSVNLIRAVIASNGCRPSEIQQRKHEDWGWEQIGTQKIKVFNSDRTKTVPVTAPVLRIPDSKMGKPHAIHVNDLMLDCLKEADEIKKTVNQYQAKWLFPSGFSMLAEEVSISGAGNGIRRMRAEGVFVNPVTLKSTRHAFATIMGNHGVHPELISLSLNHELGADVTSRHYSEAAFLTQKKEASEQWCELLKDAIKKYKNQRETKKKTDKDLWLTEKALC